MFLIALLTIAARRSTTNSNLRGDELDGLESRPRPALRARGHARGRASARACVSTERRTAHSQHTRAHACRQPAHHPRGLVRDSLAHAFRRTKHPPRRSSLRRASRQGTRARRLDARRSVRPHRAACPPAPPAAPRAPAQRTPHGRSGPCAIPPARNSSPTAGPPPLPPTPPPPTPAHARCGAPRCMRRAPRAANKDKKRRKPRIPHDPQTPSFTLKNALHHFRRRIQKRGEMQAGHIGGQTSVKPKPKPNPNPNPNQQICVYTPSASSRGRDPHLRNAM